MTALTHPAEATRRSVHAAYAALGWVVFFLVVHVYWYLGGSWGSPGALPGLPRSPVAWAVAVLIAASFPLSLWACLTIVRGQRRSWTTRTATILIWAGCVLLTARGGAGVLDDVTRVSGLLPNGITGLSLTATTGMAQPAGSVLWVGRAIDVYFLAGGITFGILGRCCRTESQAAPPA